jgi:transposase InsO family protein
MNSDIKNMVDGCDACQLLRPSQQKEELMQTTAERPMEMVSADLFEISGKKYLVMVDRYSGFPFVAQLTRTTTCAVTEQMLSVFQDWGFPEAVRTDGGPQFRTEFKEFCDAHDIKHETSSPYNSQSNGHAEAAVKNMKHLLITLNTKWADFRTALH